MKKGLIINVLCFFVAALFAQEKTNFKAPTPSPEATFTQQFGDSEIRVQYARPSAKGRKVFGGLVPFDSVWRTGAGESTTLKFKEETLLGDKKMAAAKYALFTIPTADEWTIILNSDTTLHGAFGYDAKKDVHRFKVKSKKTDRFYETFTIEINDFTPRGDASLNLMWENTIVSIPLKSLTDETIMATIQQRLVDGKEDKNADLLFQSASYYYTTQRDLKQAGAWATAAAQLDPENFYIPNLAQKIFVDLKDYRAALDMAKRAIPLGEKKKMTTTVANLQKRVAEWQTLLGEKPTPILTATETPVSKPDATPKMQNTEGVKTVDLKAQFAPILTIYYDLKNALVADNATLAAAKGKAMTLALRKIEVKNWTAKQRNFYEPLSKKLATDAEQIGNNAGKIDDQREHFVTLSKNISEVAKTLKINTETTYLQFCPMANDGKGAYWLSKEDKIKNPYYGKSMLTCGSVKETLK